MAWASSVPAAPLLSSAPPPTTDPLLGPGLALIDVPAPDSPPTHRDTRGRMITSATALLALLLLGTPQAGATARGSETPGIGADSTASDKMADERRQNALLQAQGHKITFPAWSRQPTNDEMVRLYPPAAWKKGLVGKVIVQCDVRINGALEHCEVVSESPAGAGFGAATLEAAKLFVMKPKMVDGVPVAGRVKIPMNWEVDTTVEGFEAFDGDKAARCFGLLYLSIANDPAPRSKLVLVPLAGLEGVVLSQLPQTEDTKLVAVTGEQLLLASITAAKALQAQNVMDFKMQALACEALLPTISIVDEVAKLKPAPTSSK